MSIRGNERSTVIELISEINNIVDKIDISIKRAGGENTLIDGSKRMFPDIILFNDLLRTRILQTWEVKMPDISITDSEFIYDAKRKAILLGTNSFTIWNFSSVRIYSKNFSGVYEIIYSNNLAQIKNREDVVRFESEWKKLLKEILLHLNSLFLVGSLSVSSYAKILTENIGSALIQRNIDGVSSSLREASIKDTVIDSSISLWWREFKSECFKDEKDSYDAYSKSIILNWFNKIIFAHILKRYFNGALKINEINTNTCIFEAWCIFSEITKKCNFFNVFSEMQFEELIGKQAWSDLLEVNSFLSANPIESLSQETLHEILEKTVSNNLRELSGQFTTPTVLADILTRITIRDVKGVVFDPCCGTGTVIKAVKEFKKEKTCVVEALDTIWAEDKFAYPLQITQLSLCDVEGINTPIKIFMNNVFKLKNNHSISIVDPKNGEKVNFTLPLFNTILSNLPFIPFELISDDEKAFCEEIITRVKRETSIELHKRSDIYMYIIFALWQHLLPNGNLGVITSNSWLDSEAGSSFYKALGYYYSIEQIHLSGKGKWFLNADVVTTILILKKKVIIEPTKSSDISSFFLWHKSLKELEDESFKDLLIHSSLQNKSIDKNIVSVISYSNDDIVKLQSLNISKNALFHDLKWIFNIMDSLIKIKSIFEVFRGERRGWDPMFYPKGEDNIEPQFLKKAIINSKNISSLIANPDGYAFCCDKSLKDLMQSGEFGAISWINRFSKGVNRLGEPLTKALLKSKSKNEKFWYHMSDENIVDIVTTMNPDNRLFYATLTEQALVNQRLICLKFRSNKYNRDLCHALLNSILGMFLIEASGFGRGLGVLDISASTIKKGFMLNPDLLDQTSITDIVNEFSILKSRDIKKSILEEINSLDRMKFDKLVLEKFGISKYYDFIKNSLMSMQEVRHSVEK